MRKIHRSLRKQLENNPFYKICCRSREGGCSGRITWEHAIIYAGKQVNEAWAILPLCEKHHGVNSYQGSDSYLDKQFNVAIALERATETELRLISKAIDYVKLRGRYRTRFKDRLKKIGGFTN